jgi:hypothetical protein
MRLRINTFKKVISAYSNGTGVTVVFPNITKLTFPDIIILTYQDANPNK